MECESSAEALEALAAALIAARRKGLKPQPKLDLVEWADRYRVLSSSSSEPGRWMTSRVEAARGPMLAVTESGVTEITIMGPTQLMKTEVINNIVGYFIHQDPTSILVLQPTIEMAEAWSKERLAPMLRDSPSLQGLVKDPRSRDSGNTLRYKEFPGGFIAMAGANAPATLASRPIRIALRDEVDKYPDSAGTEGDPIKLSDERTETFFNALRVNVCSPTIKGKSKIEELYEESDKRVYHVPCMHCDHLQDLRWEQVQWQRDDKGAHLPDTAAYVCESCGAVWSELDRLKSISLGRYIATAPFNGHAGFHVNKIASPWKPLSDMVRKWLRAYKSTEKRKTFFNTQLGVPFEEETPKVAAEVLYGRRYDWGKQLPDGVLVLTCAVDVQDDRLEVEVVGWGEGEESWSVEVKVMPGDPARNELWDELDEYLNTTWRSIRGEDLHVASSVIDSGGHHTQSVYEFAKKHASRRVNAIKGSSMVGKPIVSFPSRKDRKAKRDDKFKPYIVGTDAAKERIVSRLQQDEPGPGYCHFPADREREWFDQLTSEARQKKRNRHGNYALSWVKTRARNEALDLRVYNLAALYILRPRFDQLRKQLEDAKAAVPVTPKAPASRGRRNNGSFQRKGIFND